MWSTERRRRRRRPATEKREAMKPKRVRVEVRWRDGAWRVRHGRLWVDADYHTKKPAIEWADWICQLMSADRKPAELYIYTKSGKLDKGPSSRATYGKVPRKSKG